MARTRPQNKPSGKGPLAAIRVNRGLTRRQVVERMREVSGLSLHPNALGLLEAGRTGTRTDTLAALAKALGVKEQVVFDAIQKCRATFARRKAAAA